MSRKLSLLLIVALVAAACGSSDDGASSDDTKPTATATADTGATDTGTGAGGAVSTLEGVKSAVVQIVAARNLAEPEESLSSFAEVEGAGSGTGFIIDPSGIVVTNNHVVTGAATLDVYVDGQDEPVNAQVLGVSECSDLAVIDLEGDGYPYLPWYDGEIQPGLEVRAAGFPLGDPEYTLTSGIVSKAEVDGETNWASVESVIEHDANIQPGNSGGPLVTSDTGEVVAVNYRSTDPGTGTVQFRSISSDLAQPTVTELQGGDVESLGINGIAVADPESGVQGIWVRSVDTDSPAGGLGLQGGDIVERIEGLSVGTDGTMEAYCDIIRSHDPSERLSVQVLRFEEDARLEGEFNGDELAAVESLAGQVVEQTGELATEGTEYTDFVRVEDDTGTVAVEVPATWSDVDGASREGTDGGAIPSIAASPDLASFYNTWGTPGVEVLASASSPGDDLGALLDDLGAGAECVDAGREPYEDNLYAGLAQYYSDCGGDGGAALASIAAQPPDGSFIVVVLVQMTSEADLAVLDQVLRTFIVQV